MKGSSDSKPLVPIVVGALGLLAATIAFRNCGTSAPPDSAAEPRFASRSSKPSNAAGGWIAQPGASGSGSERGRLSAGSGRQTGGGSMGTTHRGSEPDDFAPPRGGTGGVRDSGERDFRDTDTTDVGGDAISARRGMPAVNGAGDSVAEPGASANSGQGQEQGAKSAAKKSDAPGSEEVADMQGTPKTPGAQDENGVVLSLPSEKPAPSDQESIAPIVVNGVNVDGDGAHFSENSHAVFPTDNTVNNTAGSFNFWIRPEWPAGDVESDAYFVHIGGTTFENHATFFKNGRYMRFLFADNSGYEAGGGRDVAGWEPGKSHMITGTWGDGITVLYLDGESADAHDYSGELVLGTNPPIAYGSTKPNQAKWTLLGQGGVLYPRALSADEVAALYAQPPP